MEEREQKKEKKKYIQEAVLHFRTKAALICLAVLIVHFGVIFYYEIKERKMLRDPIVQPEQNIIRVAGLEEEPTSTVATTDIEQNSKSSSEEHEIEETEQREKAEEMLQLIFEDKGSMVGKGQVKVSGLTANTKERLSFKEADFQAALTSFLEEQNIKTSTVSIEKEVMTSEENIVGYHMNISGNDEIELLAYFFPKLPGQYFFSLLEKEKTENKETGSQLQPQISQTEVTPQIQTEAAEKDRYDASKLTISGIPEKLLNYLDNQYELQYSLYDYLYKNGYRNVQAAVVKDYEIQAEEKVVEIIFEIKDGGNITGRYDKENKQYSFYE